MKLEETELKTIRTMSTNFHKAKMNLGDLEIQKHSIIQDIGKMKEMFVVEEKKLVEKYGTDSVINIETGEVTKKENG